jgi:hypothetical protein
MTSGSALGNPPFTTATVRGESTGDDGGWT